MLRSIRHHTLSAATAAVLLVPTAAWAFGPVVSSGAMADLDATDPALDDATARVQVIPTPEDTIVTLQVTGIDPALAGRTLGAHLHVGGCQAGDAAGTAGHYNSTGGTVVSSTTEVWLDFTVTPGGNGHSVARVPFAVPAGDAKSVVVHADPTAPSGVAGAKLACLGVDL